MSPFDGFGNIAGSCFRPLRIVGRYLWNDFFNSSTVLPSYAHKRLVADDLDDDREDASVFQQGLSAPAFLTVGNEAGGDVRQQRRGYGTAPGSLEAFWFELRGDGLVVQGGVEMGLSFRGRDVSDRSEEPAGVEPIDPCEGGVFDSLHRGP